MALWWLGDVRPLEQARLVEVAPRTFHDVARRVRVGHEVTVTQRVLTPELPAGFAYVSLLGLPPTWFYGLTRSSEMRASVRQVIGVLH